MAALPEQPRGIRYARLDRLQRELLVSLLRQYLDRAACAVANQAWTDITGAGLDQACFGWAGPVERGAGHYYALSGPSLLIEYDNTQDGANHIHLVRRDLRRDFAGDLLAQHYAGVRHFDSSTCGFSVLQEELPSERAEKARGVPNAVVLRSQTLRGCLRSSAAGGT